MHRDSAGVSVPAPVDELYAWLRDVSHWPEFLDGIDTVEPLGNRRYRLGVTWANRARSCDVVVSTSTPNCFVWRSLARPRFDGSLRLVPQGAAQTRVDLWVEVEPSGFWQAVQDSLRMVGSVTEHDLQRLRRLVADGALSAR